MTRRYPLKPNRNTEPAYPSRSHQRFSGPLISSSHPVFDISFYLHGTERCWTTLCLACVGFLFLGAVSGMHLRRALAGFQEGNPLFYLVWFFDRHDFGSVYNSLIPPF